MNSGVTLKIRKVREDGLPLPRYETPGASGLDLRASIAQPLILQSGHTTAVPTGIAVAIPPGFEGQVRPRSGLAARTGLTVLNAPGTVDSDYRGEIVVLLVLHGPQDITVQPGDRIAQLVISPVVQAEIVATDSLDDTQRGSGGFGHTGIE